MRANRCHLRVAMASLNVVTCDGALQRGVQYRWNA